MLFQDFCGLLCCDLNVAVIVVLLPEFHELLFVHAILHEKVMRMTVGLAHDGQIEICRGHGSATREKYLCECAVEHPLQSVGLARLLIQIRGHYGCHGPEIVVDILLHGWHIHTKFF